MQTVAMLIGGERRHSSGGATFVRRNPLDGEVAFEAPACTVDDALAHGATLRCGGRAGIAAFTDLRWITVQTAPRHYPF
ncbi:hypothetical protein SY91_03234 [Burkholderia cenocepacia]|nr:putative VANILLIN dehydrogenase oxidoreductase protein [Burkholderia cenocepacia]ESS37274.1 putative VANILLIN dehydrogenase oxidoreductase protein [Burkholderia cenocepacia KC-01]QND95795.1 hypothetical protein SY91_03234 [Burkholderia cenocepacia]